MLTESGVGWLRDRRVDSTCRLDFTHHSIGSTFGCRLQQARYTEAIAPHQRGAVLWCARLKPNDGTDSTQSHLHLFVATGEARLGDSGRQGKATRRGFDTQAVYSAPQTK
jgi:hypothetical protein